MVKKKKKVPCNSKEFRNLSKGPNPRSFHINIDSHYYLSWGSNIGQLILIKLFYLYTLIIDILRN